MVSGGTAAVLTLLARGTNQKEVAYGTLDYAPGLKSGGWLAITVALVLLIAAFFVDQSDRLLALALAAVMAILGGYLLLETYFTVGHFDDEQITLGSLTHPKRSARWDNLEDAAFRPYGQYYMLSFSDGTVIKYSVMLRGARDLRQHIESLDVPIRGSDRFHW